MKANKEIFKSLVSEEKTNTVSRNKERIQNRARLRESQKIALKVLTKLDEPGWSQRRLAKEMGVSPQQITKIVKGTENLTLETQVKLQEILDIPILATFYENKFEKFVEAIKFEESTIYKAPSRNYFAEDITLHQNQYHMKYDTLRGEYETYSMTA